MTTTRTYGGISAQERIAGRRAKLLDAGLELYGTRGYAATKVKDVCREAGVTDRYFYESFRSGEELFLAVFDQLTDQLFEEVAAAVIAVGSEPEPQLRAAIGAFVSALAADPRKSRVIFAEAPAAGPASAAHMRATLRRFADLVEATARLHVPPQTPDADVRLVALSLVGLLERVVTEHVDGALGIDLERVVDGCVTLYARLIEGVARA